MKKKQRGAVPFIVIIILLILIAILLLLYFLFCKKDTTPAPLPACSSGALFNVAPLDGANYINLVPLGNLNPPGHTFPTDHHYFYLVIPNPSTPPPAMPVHLPGDAWVTAISTSEHLSASPPYTDYSLTFKPCQDYEAYFGHLYDVSPDLHTQMSAATPDCNEYSTGGENFRSCRYPLQYHMSAGAQVGTAGGRIGQWALDFGAHDFRQTPLQWANQTRIVNNAPQLPYTACPSDVFTPAIKAALEARFSNYNGSVHRTTPPLCGKVDQDVPGTAQGIWFKQGVTGVYPEDPNLALVHDNIDPAIGVISMGTSIPTTTGTHSFTPAHSGMVNREFGEVTADGNIYCYNLTAPGGGSLLLKLVTDMQLQVEHRTSADCGTMPYSFTAAAVTFDR